MHVNVAAGVVHGKDRLGLGEKIQAGVWTGLCVPDWTALPTAESG